MYFVSFRVLVGQQYEVRSTEYRELERYSLERQSSINKQPPGHLFVIAVQCLIHGLPLAGGVFFFLSFSIFCPLSLLTCLFISFLSYLHRRLSNMTKSPIYTEYYSQSENSNSIALQK
ncbi:hypothetical protein BDV28DRAFT_142484 [Aspergillus coremiiformis]|uniref:Uncharacterized protein n=1 Tax=Aspergillus coremiiformis TaxID=138285 RepID=A0A5N6YW65_9EURO|nr:hypothetical protein BDV28DRAFT_142484 [Aspergillus coremiiformis]